MKSQTPIADMIAEMLKNCIPWETIILAVRSMERAVSTRQGVDETAEKRRAWDRAYRRKRRGLPPDPPDNHPISGGNGEAMPSSLSEDKKHAVVVIKKEKKERGSKLPPDWKPKSHHYEQGAALGLSIADVDDRAARMRNWCEANANRSITTKANWDAAFTGAWLKDNRNGNGTGSHRTAGATGSPQSGSDAIFAGVAAAAERRARERGAAGQQRETPRNGGSATGTDLELFRTPDGRESH